MTSSTASAPAAPGTACAALGAGADAPAAAGGPPPGGPAGHAVVRFTRSLHAALDRLTDTPTWSMTTDEQRDALVGLAAAQARLEELRLRVLVAADRDGAGPEVGATSIPAWVAAQTRSTRPAAFADLHLAAALDDGFDATRQALAAGRVNAAQARVIVAAVTALTDEYDDLPTGTHARAEAHLLAAAADLDATGLRVLGKRLFEVVCPEAADRIEGEKLAAEEARARRLAYLSLHDNGDGTTEGRFRLPTLHAELLKKALDALTSPRRLGAARLDPLTGKKLPAATLRGHGLMELVEDHLDLASMPTVNGSPFSLSVTISLDALVSGLGVATLDTGGRISAGEARRLACKAGIIPMVLDGDSVPLDLGREQRLFTKAQKTALNHRYQGCAAADCDRPPAWVEYHHRRPWQHGGRTDLADGLPLCPPHHQMADHPETWDLRDLPDGRVRFHRRT